VTRLIEHITIGTGIVQFGGSRSRISTRVLKMSTIWLSNKTCKSILKKASTMYKRTSPFRRYRCRNSRRTTQHPGPCII